ncbi:MAG: FAD-dependent oxidoreductase [Myxococcota bacterium]
MSPHPRFVVPIGEPARTDEDGFLIEVAPARPASEMLQPRALVVLGEPGSGKTTLLEDLDADVRVDLRAFTTEAGLLAALAVDKRWTTPGPRVVSIDSLDECMIHIARVGDLLVEFLAGCPLDGLRLRIACRTGAWPAGLTDRIRQLFGSEQVSVVELAPLREEDARTLVRQWKPGVEPDDLLDRVRMRRVGPLGARPVTLRLLVQVFERDGDLPASRWELYERACALLADEPDAARRFHQRRPRQASERVVHLASELAAAQFLSGHAALAWPAAGEGAPEGALDVSSLVSEDQAATLDQLWSSGLVRQTENDGRTWFHQSLGEFLSAKAFVTHRLPAERIGELLASADGAVAPALREVAAWVAGPHEGFRARLLEREPDLLLHADVATLPPVTRERVAFALLEGARQGTWVPTAEHVQLLPRLAATGTLAEPLRRLLAQDEPEDVRRLAVHMAEAFRVTDLLPRLLELALNAEEPGEVRRAATRAVKGLGDPCFIRGLRPLAVTPVADEDLELAGTALSALWPDYLTVDEVLDCVSVPGPTGFFGAWWHFVSYTLPDTLPDEALARVIDRLAEGSTSRQDLFDVRHRWKHLLERAWRAVGEPDVLAAFLRLLLRSESWDRLLEIEVVQEDGERRRRFLASLLAEASIARSDLARLEHLLPGLVSQDDLPWLLELRGRLPSTHVDTADWTIRDAYREGDATHADALLSAAERDASVAAAFAGWLAPVELDSERARSLRQHNRAHARPEPPLLDPPPTARLERALLNERGQPSRWLDVLRVLTLEARSTHYGEWFARGVEDLPGWAAADEDTRERISQCASDYLLAADPDAPRWMFGNELPWVALGGVSALSFLLPRERVPVEAWPRWAATVLATSGLIKHGDRGQSLVTQARARAPGSWREAALALLENGESPHSRAEGAREAVAVWDDAVAAKFVALVTEGSLSPPAEGVVLAALVRSGSPEARNVLRTRAHAGDSRTVAALVEHAPEDHDAWLPALERDEGVTEDVCRILAHDWRERSILTRLPAAALEVFYAVLSRRYPRASDPDTRKAHLIGPREELGMFRDTVVAVMRDRAGDDDVAALERLVRVDPDVRWSLQDARARWRRRAWRPLSPQAVLRALVGPAGPPADDVRPADPSSPTLTRTPMTIDDALELHRQLPVRTLHAGAALRALQRALAHAPAVVLLQGPSKAGKTTARKTALPSALHFGCSDESQRRALDDALRLGLAAGDVVVEDAHFLEDALIQRLAGVAKRLLDEEEVPRRLVIVGIPPVGQGFIRALTDSADRVLEVECGEEPETSLRAHLADLCSHVNVELGRASELVHACGGSLHLLRRLLRRYLADQGIAEVPDRLRVVDAPVTPSALALASELWQRDLEPVLGSFWRALPQDGQAALTIGLARSIGEVPAADADLDGLASAVRDASVGLRRLLAHADGKVIVGDLRLGYVLRAWGVLHRRSDAMPPLAEQLGVAIRPRSPVVADPDFDPANVLRATGKDGVHILGVLDSRITIRDQQARALNIVRALSHGGTRGRLAVVGAGIGGSTAAVAAALDGWDVTLFDRESIAMSMQASSQRLVHPHLFDWPRAALTEEDAGLPLMNWRVGEARAVVGVLREELGRSGVVTNPNSNILGLRRDVPKWAVDVEGSPRVWRFDAVIVAVGFGVEASHSYWATAGRDGPERSGHPITISGSGDSGLIDVLESKLRRDVDLFNRLASLAGRVPPPLAGALARLDDAWRHRDDRSADLLEDYYGLDWKGLVWPAPEDLRPEVVTLRALRPLFTPRAALLNRVAVFLLIRDGHVRFSDAAYALPAGCSPGDVREHHGPPRDDFGDRKVPRTLMQILPQGFALGDVAARSDMDHTRRLAPSTYAYFRRLVSPQLT